MKKSELIGIGFCVLLTAVLIALKMAGIIAWSWLWVVAPIWGAAALVIVLLVIVIVCAWAVDYRELQQMQRNQND